MGRADLDAGFIDAAEVGHAQHWHPPALDPGRGAPPTAAKLEALEQAAWDEGYKRGREEGRTAAREAAQPALQQLTQLIASLDKPFTREADTLPEALSQLALAIAQRLALQVFEQQPEALLPVARQALAMLEEQASPVHLRAPPAALEALKALQAESPLQLRFSADPSLAPGDLRVESNPLSVDARLASRVQQLVTGWSAPQ